MKQRDFIKNETADRTYIFGGGDATSSDGTCAASIINKPLVIYSSADLGGDGTLKCIVTYQMVVL